ncbi:MAG: aldehyde ferredoxin oxidoreductase, partial [Candidatus Thermoplasmatota archaeon]|nr:aldehyde ferredoxin oxidoreductase [Candidatus Thermoplasmatota archaeon]
MFSYTNKILDVDLTDKKIKTTNLDEKNAKKFVGGKGLGAKILYDNLKKNVDPLSPENIIIFASGPLTATLAPSSARWCVVTKSPLTNLFLDSQVGGSFGVKMKKAGFDFIIVRGKSPSPVYLNVTDESCEIVDAENLWGKGCFYTEKTLKKELGKNVSVASIGTAGEKLVRYACISIDMYRQAGRGGAGAVMGSKNLKAVAVSGNTKMDYAEPEKFKENVKKAFKKVREHPFTELRTKYGTPVWVNPVNEGGLLPTRNFQKGVFEHADEISGEKMKESIVVADESCPGCPIKCWKHSKSENNNYSFEVVGPEYETIALIGSNNMIRSIKAIAHANMLCDDFGLDTISTGDVIAFAS